MRIKDDQKIFIKNQIRSIVPDADIFLFGSRTDNRKKGGDIDILVLSEDKLTLGQIRTVKIAFFKQFGEQKIDIVGLGRDEPSTFKELVLIDAVKL